MDNKINLKEYFPNSKVFTSSREWYCRSPCNMLVYFHGLIDQYYLVKIPPNINMININITDLMSIQIESLQVGPIPLHPKKSHIIIFY